MKKIIITAALSIAVLTVLLCACAVSDNEATTQTQSTEATENESNGSTTNVADTTVVADAMNSKSYDTGKVIWGPGRAENHQQPNDPIMLQEQYQSLDASFLLKNKKQLCLTFDEGYENGYTPSILDTLKEKKVKAIFFVTYDFAKDNPDLIKRMIDEGHVVGNHTYRHYTMDEVSRDVATQEIQFLDSYINENFGYKMKLFRFPKGEFSQDTLALAKELGYKSVFWSFAYADWDTQNPPDRTEAYNEITKYIHPGEIMLLHAVSATNAEILADVIDEVRNQGYEFTVNI